MSTDADTIYVCPTCLTQYTEALGFCPDDGTELRRLKVEQEDTMPGRIIDGRWEIIKKIGAGGMGSVYLANQLNIERKVAIKTMHKGLDRGTEYIERFLREANVASQASHPNMVSIYDFGQTDDGILFIAMEYLDGNSLADVLRHTRLTIEQTIAITQQLCGALSAAHGVGIIHRDLKPENIFLLDLPDGSIFAKILDFGIAKHMNSKSMTQTGQVFGTPEYMSPEQCRGSSSLDQRSDLYALGCILYEIMTGRTPFRSETLLQVLFKHVSDPVPPLQLIVPHGSLKGFEEVVMTLLSKSPKDRYATALQVQSAIEEMGVDKSAMTIKMPAWRANERALDDEDGGGEDADSDTAFFLKRSSAPTPAANTAAFIDGETLDHDALISLGVNPDDLEPTNPPTAPADESGTARFGLVEKSSVEESSVQEHDGEPEQTSDTAPEDQEVLPRPTAAPKIEAASAPSGKPVGVIVGAILFLGLGAGVAAAFSAGVFTPPPEPPTPTPDQAPDTRVIAEPEPEPDMAPEPDLKPALDPAVGIAVGIAMNDRARASAGATRAATERAELIEKQKNKKPGKKPKKNTINPDELLTRAGFTQVSRKPQRRAIACIQSKASRDASVQKQIVGKPLKVNIRVLLSPDGKVKDVIPLEISAPIRQNPALMSCVKNAFFETTYPGLISLTGKSVYYGYGFGFTLKQQ